MRKKDTLLVGLMLFALFFGAGNLIYPPFLGMEAGESFWWAISGFVITGVGLPIIAIAAIAIVKGGAEGLANRVHPLFGLVFIMTVYLAIGPFFAIPRGANVAYEMGVRPFVEGGPVLLIFTIIFFTLAYFVSLNPSKIVERVGQWLTPALLLTIIALAVASFINFDQTSLTPNDKYETTPFFTGFLEGYLTMDTIAALAFGIIVINAFKQNGVTDQRQLMKKSITAGAIAGIGLAFVYISIGWMGVKMAHFGTYENGSEILSSGAEILFGAGGKLLLGLIVLLACFSTVVGLTIACSQYFTRHTTKISYKTMVTAIILFSFAVSNLGLNQIISYSVPALVMIYPITIVLIALAFLHRFFKGSQMVYRGAILLTGLVSLYDGLTAFGIQMNFITQLVELLPFASIGLAWLVPAIVGGIGGYILDKNKNNSNQGDNPKQAA
ncbi:branched-chain amino acid transport system II carrier protein [Anaerobacillus arseniciselenatis]|uniref:Branched-chain amino acid transport system carrier protein n=1 Tax=Anaerobacillus arseniciselenatis TaxID=85682 RepID=A0A1S2LW32_9BACI|nr:branched-chain amino acid transport system II carrier protein [Anaerobacillus arseniciselenatis]OIJ15555.1 branched-chain amino acid transport system II carrier protein [Anaerobacillus arseniciselenatis]